jgi:hypothetical protein
VVKVKNNKKIMNYSLPFLFVLLVSNQVVSQTPKVYVNYVTHNEESYVQYTADSLFYVGARTNLIQFGIDCQTKGAKWSMGNDHVMLDAILQWDTPPLITNTGGKNLLKYLHEDLGVECDPHAHASVVAYQDVAYKHTLLGVAPSSVMSGFLYNEPDASDYWWKEYEFPVFSTIDPAFSWHPEVIWGGATPGHVNDPYYHGMWKPSDTTDFFTHNASNHLISYGNGCRIKIVDTSTVDYVVARIDLLLNDINTGILPATGFYPMSFFVSEAYLWNPPFLLKLNAISDTVNVRVSQGKMEWMHIEDIVTEWKTNYGEVGFYASCDNTEFIGVAENELNDEFSIYPNPAKLFVKISPNSSSLYSVSVSDIRGQQLQQEINISGDFEISLLDYPKGIYFLRIESEESTVSRKFIKE